MRFYSEGSTKFITTCKRNTVRTPQVYNTHTSDWMTVEPPICIECQMEKLSSGLNRVGIRINEAAIAFSDSAKKMEDFLNAKKLVIQTEDK